MKCWVHELSNRKPFPPRQQSHRQRDKRDHGAKVPGEDGAVWRHAGLQARKVFLAEGRPGRPGNLAHHLRRLQHCVLGALHDHAAGRRVAFSLWMMICFIPFSQSPVTINLHGYLNTLESTKPKRVKVTDSRNFPRVICFELEFAASVASREFCFISKVLTGLCHTECTHLLPPASTEQGHGGLGGPRGLGFAQLTITKIRTGLVKCNSLTGVIIRSQKPLHSICICTKKGPIHSSLPKTNTYSLRLS